MSRLLDFSYIALTILFTVYGQLVLKWRINTMDVDLPDEFFAKLLRLISLLFDPYIFSGIVAAFLASLAWMAAMTKFELSFAYPFMALNFVLVALFAGALLNEPLSIIKSTGIILVVIGIILLARG